MSVDVNLDWSIRHPGGRPTRLTPSTEAIRGVPPTPYRGRLNRRFPILNNPDWRDSGTGGEWFR